MTNKLTKSAVSISIGAVELDVSAIYRDGDKAPIMFLHGFGSSKEDYMEKFLHLPLPKMFMYGELNTHLSYLSFIEEKGVHLSQISTCGHFPMYSNPPVMWKEIAAFLALERH